MFQQLLILQQSLIVCEHQSHFFVSLPILTVHFLSGYDTLRPRLHNKNLLKTKIVLIRDLPFNKVPHLLTIILLDTELKTQIQTL